MNRIEAMKVDGACHCGAIAYEAEADEDAVAICHCTDCQTLTGSAYRVAVRGREFQLTRGEPTIYIKTADSGVQRAHAFCGRCGGPVYSAAVEAPEVYSLRLGALRQRALFKPVRQIWCDSALPWAFNVEAVERRSKQ
jgi:hypothetical protein